MRPLLFSLLLQRRNYFSLFITNISFSVDHLSFKMILDYLLSFGKFLHAPVHTVVFYNLIISIAARRIASIKTDCDHSVGQLIRL